MKVYLDYVFLINFLFDFILLLGISIVLKRSTSKTRLLLGSFFGGISGFLVLFDISSISFFLLKFLLGFLIVIVSFSYKNIRYTVNNFIYLVILSIIMGGSLYLLNINISKVFDLYEMNRLVYIILLLIVGLIVTLVYSKYICRSRQGIINKYKTIIYVNNRAISFIGYLDTGNNLMYNNRPVLILNKDIDIDFDNKFVFIPFVTVGGSGVMKGFLVEDVIVNNKSYKNVYIGISNDKFCLYDADIILNVNLWEDNDEEINKKDNSEVKEK